MVWIKGKVKDVKWPSTLSTVMNSKACKLTEALFFRIWNQFLLAERRNRSLGLGYMSMLQCVLLGLHRNRSDQLPCSWNMWSFQTSLFSATPLPQITIPDSPHPVFWQGRESSPPVSWFVGHGAIWEIPPADVITYGFPQTRRQLWKHSIMENITLVTWPPKVLSRCLKLIGNYRPLIYIYIFWQCQWPN